MSSLSRIQKDWILCFEDIFLQKSSLFMLQEDSKDPKSPLYDSVHVSASLFCLGLAQSADTGLHYSDDHARCNLSRTSG